MVLTVRLSLPRRFRSRGERGAIVVLAALMLTVMLAMSAIALDVANARQFHRQAQASADSAALAAAQDLPDPAAVVATAKEYALANYDTPAAAWQGCADNGHLGETPDLSNNNECISIDESFSRVRVRVPNRDVETYFAGVIGVDSVPCQRRGDGRGEADPRRSGHPGDRRRCDPAPATSASRTAVPTRRRAAATRRATSGRSTPHALNLYQAARRQSTTTRCGSTTRWASTTT